MTLALGTVQFGLPYGIANEHGQVPERAVREMLGIAHANGIDTLDTAIAYGDSERVLGVSGAGAFKVITKLPGTQLQGSELESWVRMQVLASLQRLRVARLNGLLLHRPQSLCEAGGEKMARLLQQLKAEGLVEKIGVSIYDPQELGPILDNCAIDLVQAPFNLIDRRLVASGWLDRLHQAGVEVHVRSVFLQGLLLMARNRIPGRFERWAPLWDRWHGWLDRRGLSALQACLGYAESFAHISRVVVGADSPEQLQQLLDARSAGDLGEWPDLACDEQNLINPSQWGKR